MATTSAGPNRPVFDLERLYWSAAQGIAGWDSAHVSTLIDSGEFALALDEIAAAYLARDVAPPPSATALMQRLSTGMGLTDGDHYISMAALGSDVSTMLAAKAT